MYIKRRYLVLEGMDLSGKSTVIKLLEQKLLIQGYEVTMVREPGGCEMAEKIRSLVLDMTTILTPMSELLLFMAARNELYNTKVLPALCKGNIVLSDRGVGSSFIYQGIGKSINNSLIHDAFNLLLRSSVDLTTIVSYHTQTFVLDISYEVAKQRKEASNRVLDRLDVMDNTNFTLQRKAYINLPDFCDIFKNNFSVIDAETSIEKIVSQILYIAQGDN